MFQNNWLIDPVLMEDPEWRLGAAGTRSMDETAFAKYAEHLEMEDFESDLFRICCSIRYIQIWCKLLLYLLLSTSLEYK